MDIGILADDAEWETRVALTAESVKRLSKQHKIFVERGAGAKSHVADADYEKAGATLGSRAEVIEKARLLCQINLPATPAAAGKVALGLMADRDVLAAYASRKTDVLALNLIPRTTLAQMMDVLSSQGTLAGYRAVILAAEASPKLFPMFMTAAGTIAAAKVLVVGAGVAGLQAIATARRLGAVVEAFDVRKVAKEQVESLGAKFIEVPSEEDAQTSGGYAKEVSDEYKQKQAALLKEHLQKSDACITTALIPGKKAPIIVTEDMVSTMRAGAVIVDIAAEQGGNCALTKPGERHTTKNGVTIIGATHLASAMPVHASQMFSRNVEKLIAHLAGKDGAGWSYEDEIGKAVSVVRDGQVQM